MFDLDLTFGRFNFITFAGVIGTMILAKVASGFAGKVANLFLPKSVGSNLKKYAKPKGAYALVTGASDGIGKEFSFQLAKAGNPSLICFF